MMRLPRFRYVAPRTVEEVVRILAGEGPAAQVVAGGTDLLPNMKRRQELPKTVVGLRRVGPLLATSAPASGRARTLGALVTLTGLERDRSLRSSATALAEAAFSVATPHLRNMGTLGGNLCLDTRCNYYDQSWEWRRAIDFCMKKDGETCWVAPGSSRCWAVSSTDTAPAVIALGAKVRLVSVRGEREIPAEVLFADDGIRYLAKARDELVTSVELPALEGVRSVYKKCRRRGAFDFPILSVAVAAKLDGRKCSSGRIVLGSVASRPLLADESLLRDRTLDDSTIAEVADKAAKLARPLDNTDLDLSWRKRVARDYVVAALRELRGDGPQRLPTGLLPQVATIG